MLQLYRDDEPDCSEICQCGDGETLACNTICVDRAACKTDFAFYNHAAPAYQAYRGRCLCYSGRFICMRPTPGNYSAPNWILQGVGQHNFLFLKRNKTYGSNQNIFIYLSQSRSVGTFLKLILLSFENQFRYVTPPPLSIHLASHFLVFVVSFTRI